jgi:copper homeostasis protein
MVLEICVDSLQSARAAERGGAGRIELCSALSEGGITPGCGLIESTLAAVSIPVFVMVRPRAGDFTYSPDELAVMEKEIACARKMGVAGVVLGVLLEDGRIDVERTRKLVLLARPLEVTFHRAFDSAPSLDDALEDAIAAGVDRILTSGGQATALAGCASAGRLVECAGPRVKVMVCGKVRAGNIAEIAAKTHAREFHASLRKRVGTPVMYRFSNEIAPDGAANDDAATSTDMFARYEVFEQDVRELRETMLRALTLRP